MVGYTPILRTVECDICDNFFFWHHVFCHCTVQKLQLSSDVNVSAKHVTKKTFNVSKIARILNLFTVNLNPAFYTYKTTLEQLFRLSIHVSLSSVPPCTYVMVCTLQTTRVSATRVRTAASVFKYRTPTLVFVCPDLLDKTARTVSLPFCLRYLKFAVSFVHD